MVIFALLIIFILILIILLISVVGKKSILDTQKRTPFECGFNSISHKRIPFSIHFFLIAVIFLVFDIEIIIILPMVLTINVRLIFFWLITSITFILILILGLYYEWRNGILNWTS